VRVAVCFRNATWREWIGKALKDRYPEAPGLLESFTANFAKWRYEAIVDVLTQLNRLRRVATMVREEMFANTQEKETVQQAINAFRDARFWQWCSVLLEQVFKPLEGWRHWGMVCPCCGDKRRANQKKITCSMKSRRLHQAWDFLQKRIADLNRWANNLTMQACEESRTIFRTVQSMLRLAAATIRTRFRYLGMVPWLLSTADTQAGAKECVAQIDARPLADHDPVTRDFVARWGDDLRARANGGALSGPLADAVKALRNCPLDESCGGCVHRATNHEKVRAPSSRHVHLKGTVRHRQVLKTAKAFVRKHGVAGKRVLRYEWKSWKRVLRANPKKKTGGDR